MLTKKNKKSDVSNKELVQQELTQKTSNKKTSGTKHHHHTHTHTHVKKEKTSTEKSNKKKKSQPAIVVNGNFIRVKLSGSLLKFSSLYTNEKIAIKLLITFVVSIISAFIGVIFVQNTGLYNVGFESFAQGLGRLASYLVTSTNPVQNQELGYTVFNSLFWSLIVVVNIPLIIFGWYKIGKRFTLYTSIYIVFSSAVGLAFGFIPGFDKVFIFSNLSPDSVYALNNVQILEWDANADATKHLAIFIYGFIYGILQALCYAILFIIGCSSGGLDFLVVWYAEKKYKNLGTIFTYCNIFCFIISYIIGTYVPASLVLQHVQDSVSTNFANAPDWLNTKIPNSLNWLTGNSSAKPPTTFSGLYTDFYNSYEKGITSPFNINILFSPNFLSTIIMSIILGLVINLYFPKYQMCKVEIHSRRSSEIRDFLISQNKPYSISIYTIEGGYSRQPQHILATNCMFIDAANLLESVREFDANALLIVTLLKSIDGYVYLSAKKEESLKLFKFFKIFKSKFINEESKISEKPHDIELKGNEDVTSTTDQKVVDVNSEVEKIEVPGLDFIEASEVYDEELEQARLKAEEEKQRAEEEKLRIEQEKQKAEEEKLKAEQEVQKTEDQQIIESKDNGDTENNVKSSETKLEDSTESNKNKSSKSEDLKSKDKNDDEVSNSIDLQDFNESNKNKSSKTKESKSKDKNDSEETLAESEIDSNENNPNKSSKQKESKTKKSKDED